MTARKTIARESPNFVVEGRLRATIPEKIVKPWKLPPQQTYVLKNCNVVDSADGVVRPNITVKLADGIIKSVLEQNSHSDTSRSGGGEDDEDAIVIDLAGKYLSPGLIDCHVHLSSTPGDATLAGAMPTDPAVSLLRQPFACAQALARGFTTLRDCGGATLALKEALADDVFPGPRIFIAARALSQTGGHGDTRSAHDHSSLTGGGCCGTGEIAGLSTVCDGVPECTRAAREQLRTGADFIKIMVGGGVASPTDRIENVQFTAAEVAAVTEVARGHGTYVTAHAYTPRAIRHAVEGGCSGIEHGNLLDADTANLMAARNVWLVPTLVTYDAMASDRYAGFLPPENQAKNREVLDAGLRSLEIASAAGVSMCYGSDLLGPLTADQSREFGIRSRILTNAQVLQSATINAAKMLRQEAFLGQIMEGFAADVLILNNNPLEDVSILDKPEKHVLVVMKNGRVYKSR